MSYQQILNETKSYYPFLKWRELYDDGLEQYTEENCNKVQQVFDKLIDELTSLGQSAPENQKVALFQTAILALNDLNEKEEGLIETDEREDLCELIDQITIASGLNPQEFGDGEGIADEWREW